MMTVVHGSPQLIWCTIKPTVTIYTGSLVCIDLSGLDEGVIVRGQADGAADTTNKDVPLGVVVGNNLRNPLWSNTYKAPYITEGAAGAPATSTTEFVNVGGAFSKSERRGFVQVACITPSTVLRCPIYNNAVGTAPTLLTVTTGSDPGLSCTTNATQNTPVADLDTIYFRTGANSGLYRITDDTNTTTRTWDVATNNAVVAGDTAVNVPVRHTGFSYVRFGDDTVCSYLNCSETAATDYDVINVLRLDLEVAGREYVEFSFGGDHFDLLRA